MVKNFMGAIVLIWLRLLAYGVGFLPRRAQLVLGFLLGKIYFGFKIRKTIVIQNLKRVFPGLNELQTQKMLRSSYTHLGNLTLEILMLLGPFRAFVRKVAHVEGFDHFIQARKQGVGVIFLSSHVGNWEVMAASGGVIQSTDLMLVTKRLKPAWLHQAIERGRARCQVRATYEPKTLRDVLGHLKKNGTVGFVLDQYVGPPVGVRVPFFGVPVGAAQVVAVLVRRTGAPILPVENFRTADGKWKVVIHPPVVWKFHTNPHYELALNTAEYASIIEKSVRDHPEQWLWIHRRFKGDLSPLREGEWFEPRVRK